MKIRKAREEDLKEIAEIFRVESSKKPYSQGWNKKTAFEKIKASFKNREIYVVIFEKKIVGLIILVINKLKKEIYMDELWLRREYQGRGLGTSLVKFVENKYRKKDFKNITVAAIKKAKAVDFYKKLNYKTKYEYLYLEKRLK